MRVYLTSERFHLRGRREPMRDHRSLLRSNMIDGFESMGLRLTVYRLGDVRRMLI